MVAELRRVLHISIRGAYTEPSVQGRVWCPWLPHLTRLPDRRFAPHQQHREDSVESCKFRALCCVSHSHTMVMRQYHTIPWSHTMVLSVTLTPLLCTLLCAQVGFHGPSTGPLDGGANGGGSLVYPGLRGPIATNRLVNIADGIEVRCRSIYRY